MRKALLPLMLLSSAALAEPNPFLPPEARQPVQTPGMPAVVSPDGRVLPAAPVISPQAEKTASLQGAKMIAIINGEEVWYKPTEGIYVRYPASQSSKSTLEAQASAPEVEAIEQKIADVQKSAQKPNKQAKKW